MLVRYGFGKASHRRQGRQVSFDGQVLLKTPVAEADLCELKAELAAQLQQALLKRYSPHDVAAFALHLKGNSYRDIQKACCHEQSVLARKVKRMKAYLFTAFKGQWQALLQS